MKLSEADQLGIDLLAFRANIAAFVLLKQGQSTGQIAMRLRRNEKELEQWVRDGCPLLELVDSVSVTSGTTSTDEVMRA